MLGGNDSEKPKGRKKDAKTNRRTKRKIDNPYKSSSKSSLQKKKTIESPNAVVTSPPKSTIRKRISQSQKKSTCKKPKLNEEEMAVLERLKRKAEMSENDDDEEEAAASVGEDSPDKPPRRTSRSRRTNTDAREENPYLHTGEVDDDDSDNDGEDMDEEGEDVPDLETAIVDDGGDSDEEQVVCLEEAHDTTQALNPLCAQNFSKSETKSEGPVPVDSVDESVTKHLVKELKNFMVDQIDVSVNRVLREVKKEMGNMGRIQTRVEELSTIITTSAAHIFIKQPNAHPRVKEIHKKICLLPALFNEKFMLKVLSRTLMGSFLNMVIPGSSYNELESKGLDMLSILYFAKQNNEKSKEKYTSATGKLFSKFRQSYLTTAFLAMQDNSFNTFTDYGAIGSSLSTVNGPLSPGPMGSASEGTGEDTSPGIGTAIAQPFWLKPGVVRLEHCHSALLRSERRSTCEPTDEVQQNGEMDDSEAMESSQSSARSKISRSGPITNDEVASEAAYMASKIITGILYKCRPCSKVELFNNVLYLFTGWAQHDMSIEQRNLEIKWLKQASHDVDYVENLQVTRSIRLTEVVAREDSAKQQLDLDNIKRLETFIGEHPELTIIVEHDVIVNEKPRRLRRHINLIETITKLIASYCTLESNSKSREALGVHKNCFKVIIVMAIGLRRLMERAVHDLNSSPSVPWAGNLTTKGKKGRPKKVCSSNGVPRSTDLPTYQFETLNGLCLESLQPSSSKQKVNLSQMILAMTDEEYLARNDDSFNGSHMRTYVNNDQDSPVNYSNTEVEKDRLKPDESNGVFVIH